MKIIRLWKNLSVITALLLVVMPVSGKAGALAPETASLLEGAGLAKKLGPLHDKHCRSITNRPLSDFLNAQGTLDNPPQFFPPVKDYVGWADTVDPTTELPTTFALVDYAGLANQYIKKQKHYSLGTKVTGYVVECERPNGKAQVSVALFTTKALGFAQSLADLAENNFDFLTTPTIFGVKAATADQANAAVGPATLFVTFSMAAPGTALPDLLDVTNNPASYAPVKLNFVSTTFGKCSDGRKARLDVQQSASTNTQNVLVFSNEHVQLVTARGGTCLQ